MLKESGRALIASKKGKNSKWLKGNNNGKGEDEQEANSLLGVCSIKITSNILMTTYKKTTNNIERIEDKIKLVEFLEAASY